MLIDISLLLILIFGFYRGFSKGLIHAIFSTIAWLLGLILAFKLTTVLSPKIELWLHVKSEWVPLVTFLLIFIAVLIIVMLTGKAVEKIFDLTHLGMINKIAGGIISAIILFFVFTQLLFIMNEAGMISPAIKDQSKLYAAIEKVSPVMMNGVSTVMPFAKTFVADLKNYFDQLNVSLK